jgi:head-tail adaptor
MLNREGKKKLATEARHLITIQSDTKVADGQGGFTTKTKAEQKIFAAIYPIRAQKLSEYRSTYVNASHILKVSGLVEIPETATIGFGSRTFTVLSVENLQERGFEKVVICSEVR